MSAKDEIKGLFEYELMQSPEYTLAQQLVLFLKDEIATPHVNEYVSMTFNNRLNESQQGVFKMCCILLLGFEPITVTDAFCVVHMKNFLA